MFPPGPQHCPFQLPIVSGLCSISSRRLGKVVVVGLVLLLVRAPVHGAELEHARVGDGHGRVDDDDGGERRAAGVVAAARQGRGGVAVGAGALGARVRGRHVGREGEERLLRGRAGGGGLGGRGADLGRECEERVLAAGRHFVWLFVVLCVGEDCRGRYGVA